MDRTIFSGLFCGVFAVLSPLPSSVLGQCLAWKSIIVPPGPRTGHALAYDSARDLTVVFGGIAGPEEYPHTSETYGWDGQTWTLLAQQGPSSRFGHAMAFDTNRGVMVLFGGSEPNGWSDDPTVVGDTWEWDGQSWALRSTSGPSARYGHRLVFDSARGKVLLYGGASETVFNDLWEWDGLAWTLINAIGPQRYEFGMAYDLLRNRLVLHGGIKWNSDENQFPIDQSDTWEWDGSGWFQVSTTLPNVGGGSSRIVFDESLGVTLIAGAYERCPPIGACNLVSETYAWNGSMWTRVSTTAPTLSYGYDVVYDSNRGFAWLMGGGMWGSATQEVWKWDGTEWTIRRDVPPERAFGGMVYDSWRDLFLIYGGEGSGLGGWSYLQDTWTWNGSTWLEHEGLMPPARSHHGMAYDEIRGVTVLFGGSIPAPFPQNHEYFGDTWEWDGGQWNLMAVPDPTPRAEFAMCFDRDRGVTVLFGGRTASGNSFETWEWDGVSWALRDTAGPSPVYQDIHMVYDSLRRVSVLFTGHYLDGTWEWDGTTWTAAASGAWGLYGQAMVHDASKGISYLLGGFNPNIDFCSPDMYDYEFEYDGNSWVTRYRPSTLHRVGHSAVYNSLDQKIVAFGGMETCSIIAASVIWEHDCGRICDPPQPLTPEACASCTPGSWASKNRYISFRIPLDESYSNLLALRVTLAQMPGPEDCPNVGDFASSQGEQMWVGNEDVLANGTPTGVFRLQSQPLFRDWSNLPGGVVHVSDCNIIPCATYTVEAVTDLACDVSDPNAASPPLVITTCAIWGDVVGAGNNQLPNGVVDFVDIAAGVDRFRNLPTAPPGTWCDLGSVNPNQGVNLNIDFGDIALVVEAFRGRSYPYSGPTAPDPCP